MALLKNFAASLKRLLDSTDVDERISAIPQNVKAARSNFVAQNYQKARAADSAFRKNPVRQQQADTTLSFLSGMKEGLGAFTGLESRLPGGTSWNPRTTQGKIAGFAGGAVGYAIGPGRILNPLEGVASKVLQGTRLMPGILPRSAPIVSRAANYAARKTLPALAAESASSIPAAAIKSLNDGSNFARNYVENVAGGMAGRGVSKAVQLPNIVIRGIKGSPAPSIKVKAQTDQPIQRTGLREVAPTSKKPFGGMQGYARSRLIKPVQKRLPNGQYSYKVKVPQYAGDSIGKEINFKPDPNNPRKLLRIGGPQLDNTYGVIAGFEPEYDEQGKITGVRFNPTKAAAGLAVAGGIKAVKSNLPTKGVSPRYKNTLNINNPDDAEYIRRVFSDWQLEDFKNGNFGNRTKEQVEDILRSNLDFGAYKKPKLEYKPMAKGEIKQVFHGTSLENLPGIKAKGLIPGNKVSGAVLGGGYGQVQSTISTSTDPNIASLFTGSSREGAVIRLDVAENARIVKANLEDAIDLEPHLKQLKKEKVDAVFIGGGEKEIVIINPKILTPQAKRIFEVYQSAGKVQNIPEEAFGLMGGFEPVFDEEGNFQGMKFNSANAILGLGAMAGIKAVKGKYKIIKQEGIVEVDGTPVKIADGLNTFIHKDTGGWVVSEKSSGRLMASGVTKKEAITKAKNAVRDIGIDKTKEIIAGKQLPATEVVKEKQVDKFANVSPEQAKVDFEKSWKQTYGNRPATIESSSQQTKTQPTKGVEAVIDRTKLTGKQLDTPNNKLFSGKDLPLTQKQLLQTGVEAPQSATPKITASQLLTSNGSPARFDTILPSGKKQGIRLVGGQTPTPPVSKVPAQTQELWTQPKQTVKANTERLKVSSSNQSIPPDVQAEIKAVERAVDKKVGILDYLRTPDRVLKKIGLEKEATQIKQAYNNYLDELPQQIDKITQWSKRVGAGAEQRIFRYLDGQKQELSGEELKVAEEIKVYLKNWADRLGLPEDSRIASYITHIFEKDFIQKEFDPDLAKIIDNKIPASVYDPFLQKRLGQMGYVEDVFRALDAYVKRATRKANMDPALFDLEANASKLDIDSWKYVKNYTERINLRPTELDNLLDNFIKQSPIGYRLGQRPVATVSRRVRQMVYRGTLGLNVGSAIRNLTQGVNTYSQLGEVYTGVGYMKALRSAVLGDDELARVGVLRDNMVQDRAISATKKFWENLDKGLFVFFEAAEKINRGAAYYGAKSKALSQGKSESEAIKAGVEMARKTQFTFGSVDTPVALQSDLVKLVTQFQSFNVKQTEFLGEMLQNKQYAGMVRWVAANAVILATVGEVMGWDYKDMIPFGDIIGGERQFGATPPMQLAGDLGKLALGGKDKFNQPVGLDTIANDLVPFIPAGVQIKKTLDGLGDVARGYDQSSSGRVKFPIAQTPGAAITAGVLGTSKTKEARDYKASGGSVLGEKQSELFKQAGSGRIKLFNDIQAKRKQDSELDAIKESVRNNGEGQAVGNKYVYYDEESGNVKTIDTNFTVAEPKLTGNDTLDKKLISKYKGKLTSTANDIVKLWELGQLTDDEAEKLLDGLQKQADKTKKPKKVKIKATPKISVPAIKVAKAAISKGSVSLPKIKIASPGKSQAANLSKGALIKLSQQSKPKKITFNKIKVSKGKS